jgi:putative hydroxymethylpyrimidine transport system substrate-binding protein
VDALLQAAPELDRGLQQAAVEATLPVFFPADAKRPFGWQDPEEWQRYIDWMLENGLIKRQQNAEQVLTNEFLAGQGLDPRDALQQD